MGKLNLFPAVWGTVFPSSRSSPEETGERSRHVRKFFITLGLTALLAAFGCSGSDSSAPAVSGRLSNPKPPDTTGKPATTDSGKPAATGAAGKATAAGGAITPENTKIEFVGAAPDHKHDGGFNKFSGSAKPIDGDITKATIHIEIQADSIWTDDDNQKKMLTPHLKSPDFFDTKQHPTVTFDSKEIKAEKKEDTTHVISGDLTLHGVTKPVSIPAKVTVADDSVTIDGHFTIDRREFDFGKKFDTTKLKNEITVKVLARVPRK
jgi:polyisoprenoid-binding protein YceI